MKLFNKQEIDQKAKELFLGAGNRSAFLAGVIYSEKITLPLFVEFTTWCARNYVPINDHDDLRYWLDFKDWFSSSSNRTEVQYSIDELFEIWIKTKQ